MKTKYFGEPIHFHNLGLLVIMSAEDSELPKNVIFHQLSGLQLGFEYDPTDRLTQFLGEQVISNLHELTIGCEQCSLSKELLLEIPQKQPNLLEFTIATKTTLLANEVLDFLTKNKHLSTVTMLIMMEFVESQRLKQDLSGICTSTEVSSTFQGFTSIKLQG